MKMREYLTRHRVFAAVWKDDDVPIDELLIEWALSQYRSGYRHPAAKTIWDAHLENMLLLSDSEFAGAYWRDRYEAETERLKRAMKLGMEVADRLREQSGSDLKLARYAGDTPLLGDPT